jgi:4-carboxymuconolactone decarboxylase
MAIEPNLAQNVFGDVTPALADYTEKVLFGDLWQRPNLSPRDRSLVTISCLISMYRMNEVPTHLKIALENGLTKDEIAEAVTHLAFYAGWPAANSTVSIMRRIFQEAGI